MSARIVLSVVIPTHDRCPIVARNLAALSHQTSPGDAFEVIVVADDCHDDTAEMTNDYARQAPYVLRLLSHRAGKAAATRNLGASAASGSILLFLDDDVLAEPGLVRAHMDAQAQNRVVLGYSKPMMVEKPSWWQRHAHLWWEDVYTSMRQPGHRFSYRDFFSGNASLSAALFKQVGGFDASMTGRLEDYELGMRLLKVGARFHFEPEAVGYHHDQTDLALWLHRIRQEGISDVQIGERHPELRTQLFADYSGLTATRDTYRHMIRKVAFSSADPIRWFESLLLGFAAFCERRRMRGLWAYATGALREYFYWNGVASAFKGQQDLASWLQEVPLPPALADNAPRIDIAAPPGADDFMETLRRADKLGLRLTIDGVEVLTIRPQLGFEFLREEHVWRALQDLAGKQFIPALGLKMIQSMEGGRIPCALNFAK